MKKVLLLGALLSTMAFGAGPEGAAPATKTVTFTGTAVPVLEIRGDGSFAFGEVVVNTTKTMNKTFKIIGSTTYTVKLDAVLSGGVVDSETQTNVLTVGIGSEGNAKTATESGISLVEAGTEKNIYIKYAPTKTEHSLKKGETLTLTATYE